MSDLNVSDLWILSLAALEEVDAVKAQFRDHRTVWYFEPISADVEDDWDLNSSFWSDVRRHIADRFPEADGGIVGGHCGVELIDPCAPTSDWLRIRMPEMTAFANATALVLRGWAYEPVGFPGGVPPQAMISPQVDKHDNA